MSTDTQIADRIEIAGTVVRTPTGWRFREVRITLAWMHEN